MTPAETETLVRELISGDPAAAVAILARATTSDEPLVLTAAALLDPAAAGLLARAVAAATRRQDRQITALAAAHLAGDRERVSALAREHLLEHPDSLLAAWIAAGAITHRDSPTPARTPRIPPLEPEPHRPTSPEEYS
jgi:hypothetical protein